MMACDILRQSYGIAKVENLVGGIDLWSEEVDPDMPRY
jgi:rhodanese-related sulfurtransferase